MSEEGKRKIDIDSPDEEAKDMEALADDAEGLEALTEDGEGGALTPSAELERRCARPARPSRGGRPGSFVRPTTSPARTS